MGKSWVGSFFPLLLLLLELTFRMTKVRRRKPSMLRGTLYTVEIFNELGVTEVVMLVNVKYIQK